MQAAEKGSEPTRNSFVKSRVLFSSDPEIEGIVARIPVFQEREREEKLLSFYSDLHLNYNYFWKCCKPDGYMKIRTASEIVYALYRLVLQENRVLFPSNRRLEDTVAPTASRRCWRQSPLWRTSRRDWWRTAGSSVRLWILSFWTGSWRAIISGRAMIIRKIIIYAVLSMVWTLKNGGFIPGR